MAYALQDENASETINYEKMLKMLDQIGRAHV